MKWICWVPVKFRVKVKEIGKYKNTQTARELKKIMKQASDCETNDSWRYGTVSKHLEEIRRGIKTINILHLLNSVMILRRILDFLRESVLIKLHCFGFFIE